MKWRWEAEYEGQPLQVALHTGPESWYTTCRHIKEHNETNSNFLGKLLKKVVFLPPFGQPKDYVHTVTDSLSEITPSKEDLWYLRYGHLGVDNLKKLAKDKLVEDFDYSFTQEISICEPCLKGKHKRNQFPPHSERMTSEPLELIHSDVCGKLSTKSLGGAEYFVTLTDDKTRYVWVYVIKKKIDVFRVFSEWKTEAEKSLGRSMKTLRTDNGGEFTSAEFEEYLRKEGIKHEITIPNCPEQNGVAER